MPNKEKPAIRSNDKVDAQDPPEILSSMETRKRSVTVRRFLVSFFLSAGIIYGLLKLTHVSPAAIVDTLSHVSPTALILGFLLHLAAYFLRSLRFRVLIHSKKVPVRSLFDIAAVHNFMNHILPMRAGELSYIYLVRYQQGVPLGEGVGTLTIARIMDLMAFAIFYPVAMGVLYLQGFPFPSSVWKVLLFSMPLFLLLVGLLFFLSFKGKTLLPVVQRLSHKMGFRDSRLILKILNLLDKAVQSFEHLKSTRIYMASLFLSFAILGAVYLVAYVLLNGMGYVMSIPLVIFCSTLAYVGSLFPLYSFAGFGTLEAGWAVGCVAAGFSKEMGMTSGFSFHIIVLAYVTLVGIYGLIRTGIPSRARNGVGGTVPVKKEEALQRPGGKD